MKTDYHLVQLLCSATLTLEEAMVEARRLERKAKKKAKADAKNGEKKAEAKNGQRKSSYHFKRLSPLW